MTESRRDLTSGIIWKKIIIFFLPIAAGTCIQQLYNAVDGLIVGKYVGTTALAAVGGSSSQIINLLIGFFVALTSGASVVIAQIYGAGKAEDVQRASGNAIAVCALMGVILMLFGLIATPWMLKLLKTPEDTLKDSILYLRIYFAGVPFILVLNMESNMLRAVGDSYNPFIFMVIGCFINIALDLVFVLLFSWGVAGVALATVIAQIANMILLTWKLLTVNEKYRLKISSLRLNGRYLANMMRIGVPSGLQSSMYAFSNMIVQIGINTLGTVVVASWALASKTDGIYWAISNALGAAITTFIGQNIGAGKMDRVMQCVKQGITLALVITVVISSGLMLIARPLLRLLTNDPQVIDTTYVILTYFVPYYFTWALIEVLSAVLRGAGDAVNPVIIIGLGICLFRIIWVATVFTYFKTLFVLCICYVISWVITGTALLIYYKRGKWIERTGNKILY